MIKNLRNDNEAVSPVVGVILMVAITVILAVVVFVMVSDIGDTDTDVIQIVMHEEDDQSYMVYSISEDDLDWADLDVAGCDIVPIGTVAIGDIIDDCDEDVLISYNNKVIWRND